MTIRAVVKLKSLFKKIIITMTIIINNRKIFDASLAERQSKIYIFFVFVFCFSAGANKRKQTFSSYCKWCDYQITFIVTKFEKKKKEQRKLTKFCNYNINANIRAIHTRKNKTRLT